MKNLMSLLSLSLLIGCDSGGEESPLNMMKYKKFELQSGRIVSCKLVKSYEGVTVLRNCKDGNAYISQVNVTFLGFEND